MIDRRTVVLALGCSLAAQRVFARTRSGRSTPEDAAFVKDVEARLVAKADELKLRGRRDSGRIILLFTLDPAGGLTSKDFLLRTGDAELDALALRVIAEAAPFPKPPATLKNLTWTFLFDTGRSKLTMAF